MKRHLFIVGLLLVCSFTKAQNHNVVDTLYANDQKNVALFFPQPIRQGITGAENFVFTFNREQEQHLGLLQAKPGKESNLLVISRDGSVYSYILKYRKQLSRLTYFIPKASCIGKENPIGKDSIKISNARAGIERKNLYYQKLCSYLIKKKQRIGRIKKRKEGIVLSVENIVFDKEELYFVIGIKNTSTLDYDLNFLDLSVQTRQ